MTQDTRRCKVTSPLGEDALILTALDASERVSGPFHFDCQFVSGDEEIDFAKIIGQSMTLELEMAEGEPRYFNGRVARFSQSDAEATGAIYHARLVPWFWFLTRRTDCRIFQGDSVLQILDKVFAGHKQIADYKPDIEGTYDPIPYCVQYRESDFHFASRLMEEWGIGYYFEHTQKAHKMILFNAPSKIVSCPGQAKASCSSAASDEKTAGHVFDWRVQQEFRSGACALTDYNYRDPQLDLGVQKKTRKGVGGNEAFEIFDYPGSYQALGPGDKRAQLRIEAEECGSNAIHGNSSCYGFTPGYKFDLVGHVRDSFNDTYLITEVHHTFAQTVGAGRGGATGDYRNSFGCVPHAIPYRPACTTPKPLIQGAQTATVVGEGGKEIDIDDLGCVYVKFHWDRNSKGDATSSCRIRVSESWAGKGWGAFFAPRIGQEVIVEFLEGDPDRPIITGRVYNASCTPPYQGGNQSGIKSHSTMKGGAANFNELRFDDTKGSELVSMQAEKNMTTLVKNDDSLSVGGNRTHSVTKDETITIGKNQTTTVTDNQSMTIRGHKIENVTWTSTETVLAAKIQSIGGAHQLTVGGIQNETVVGAKIEETLAWRGETVAGRKSVGIGRQHNVRIGKNYNLNIGKDWNQTVDGEANLKVAKKMQQQVDGDMEHGVKGKMDLIVKGKLVEDAQEITLTAKDKITLVCGSSTIVLQDSGITIKGSLVEIN